MYNGCLKEKYLYNGLCYKQYWPLFFFHGSCLLESMSDKLQLFSYDYLVHIFQTEQSEPDNSRKIAESIHCQ